MKNMRTGLVKNRKGEMVERRQWLKDIRAEKGLTVREAAQTLGMSWTHLSDIENGRRRPSLELAVKIGHFFGFEAEKFIAN
jgi:DNA-binding XRE family transcriptional regulator